MELCKPNITTINIVRCVFTLSSGLLLLALFNRNGALLWTLLFYNLPPPLQIIFEHDSISKQFPTTLFLNFSLLCNYKDVAWVSFDQFLIAIHLDYFQFLSSTALDCLTDNPNYVLQINFSLLFKGP